MRFQDFRVIIIIHHHHYPYLLTRTSLGADFFTKRLHSRWRCARTPSDRFSLAVNSYGRSWGSSRADTERCHNIYARVLHVRKRGALSACACAWIYLRARGSKVKNKWKNNFYEMKGDVGMSLHEKERNKKMPTPRHKVTHNPIPTSLFLPRLQRTFSCRQLDVKMLCCLLCLTFITNKQTNNNVKAKQRCRDGVMCDFVSWCRHLPVPFTSLHPPSFPPPMLLYLTIEPVSHRLEVAVDSAEQQHWTTHSSVTLRSVERDEGLRASLATRINHVYTCSHR